MPVRLHFSRASCHDIRIEIYRINRIGDGNRAFCAEYLLDIAAIAFGTIAYENLIFFDAEVFVVIFDDLFDEEVIALLRAIAAEGCRGSHFIDSFMHGFDTGWRQRLGDITDSERNDIGLRMCFFIVSYTVRCFTEKVAAL